MVSHARPIDRLDYAVFSTVLQYCSFFGFLYWINLRIGPLFCPSASPRFWSFLRGGESPLSTVRGGAGNPPSPRGGATIPYLKASKQAMKTFENKKHQKHELILCALLTRAILKRNHFCREVFPKLCEFCFVPLELKIFWF